MEKSLGLAFGVRVRVGLGVNKLDVNYNIVTSPLYSSLAIAALGYSGPESHKQLLGITCECTFSSVPIPLAVFKFKAIKWNCQHCS